MTSHAERKPIDSQDMRDTSLASPLANDETSVDEATSHDLVVDEKVSENLEGILGKISAIMSEAPSGKRDALAHEQPGDPALAGNTPLINQIQEISVEPQKQPLEDGFVASEPVDLLAPYSDVLNDVRDYFRDKHSLDPQHSLLETDLSPEKKSLAPPKMTLSVQDPVKAHRNERGAGEFDGRGNAATSQQGDDAVQETVSRVDNLFTAANIEQSFRSVPRAQEAVSPEGHEIEVFRRELMDRIGQLEQVIGHHFGNEKNIAADAAKAAVALTLKSLDETSIGRRLSELELAMGDLKKAQIDPSKMAGIPGVTNEEKAPQDRMLTSNPTTDVSLSSEKRMNFQQNTPKTTQELAVQATQGRAVHTEGLAPDAFGRGDAPVPREERQPSEGETDKDEHGSEDLNLKKSMMEFQRLSRMGPSDSGFGQKAKVSEVKNDMPNLNLGPDGADRPEQMVDEDAFLSKSADLRAQFKRSKIISNDDDLQVVQRRGSRLAIIIVTIALSLAALGIAFGNKSLSDFSSIGAFFKGFDVWRGAGLESGKTVATADKKDGFIVSSKNLVSKTSNEDVIVTGNISQRNAARSKSDLRLSDGKRKEAVTAARTSPDRLLSSEKDKINLSAKKLDLPPALIGPYSLRHAAAKGDVQAQYEIAHRFGIGQGVERDHEAAFQWYLKAASQGFAPAQYRLATLYERGRGVERSFEQAQVWYKRAGQLGNLKAMHNLAVITTAIDKNNPDYETAVYWFKEAANRNLADSQFNLAILYQNGVGVPQNLVESYFWFALAAKQSDLDAASRRDILEKKLSKKDLFLAKAKLRTWRAIPVEREANQVGLDRFHVISTTSHGEETADRSKILTAQFLLRNLGYDVKEVDGVLNQPTVMAIKKFEKDKGLPITGKITKNLISVMNKVAF